MERKSGIGECRGGGRGRRGELLGVESGQKRKAVVAGEGKQREEGMDLSRRHTRTGAAKQASFSGWGRRFHAATVTRSGGERSWIWAAVSLSTTIIGAPQLGQSQRGLDSRGVDVSGSVWGGTARVLRSTAVGEWSGAGWRGSRSGGCGRSPWEAGATGSGAGTHRAIRSSVSVHGCERSLANQR